MIDKTDEKQEPKAPETAQCSDCGRTKGKDGVTIYAKKCSICRVPSKKMKPRTPEAKKTGRETKPPGPETKEPVLTKKPRQIVKKSPGEKAGPGPDEEITVSVDFTRYPNIHKRLLALAEKEFRTLAHQLLYLLHDHLEGLEERASKQEGAADGR